MQDDMRTHAGADAAQVSTCTQAGEHMHASRGAAAAVGHQRLHSKRKLSNKAMSRSLGCARAQVPCNHQKEAQSMDQLWCAEAQRVFRMHSRYTALYTHRFHIRRSQDMYVNSRFLKVVQTERQTDTQTSRRRITS